MNTENKDAPERSQASQREPVLTREQQANRIGELALASAKPLSSDEKRRREIQKRLF
jgi:hypothetical protein